MIAIHRIARLFGWLYGGIVFGWPTDGGAMVRRVEDFDAVSWRVGPVVVFFYCRGNCNCEGGDGYSEHPSMCEAHVEAQDRIS